MPPDPHTPGHGGRGPALFVTVLAFAFCVAWSFAVPVFESPDEPYHWQYARFLHDQRRLPYYDSTFVEANSPPLYYALIAVVARPTELPPRLRWLGPDGRVEMPFPPRSFLNASDDLTRYWPVRVARLLTCVMMAAAVWLSSRAACSAAGSPVAGLLAAAFVGFLPQFTFRGGTVSNDTLTTTFSAALVVLLVGYVRRGATTGSAALGGVCLAAAYLTKISAICLGPAVMVAAAFGGGPLRRRVRWAAVVLGVAFVLVLPWSLRNVVLYGDPFASRAMHTAVANLIAEKPLASPYFYRTFPSTLARSFVGKFGWMNVPMPEWIYWTFLAVIVAGGVAVAVGLVRRRIDLRIALVLGLLAVASLAVVVRINLTFNQAQGRYLFPALPAIGVLWAVGMEHWLGSHRRGRLVASTLAGVLVGLNAFVLVAVVRPAYHPPVAATVSRATRDLRPTATHGLDLDVSGWWRVSHVDPQLAFATDSLAEDFAFLQFAIEGVRNPQTRRPRRVRGSVSFAANGGPADAAGRSSFDWIADGRPNMVIVPLLKNPSWRGNVTDVRVEPFEPATDTAVGCRIRISNVQLRGSPDLE